MATVLDLGLLEGFSVLFSFLLVFVIIYGLLSYTKLFGDNQAIHAIIGISFAVLTLFAPKALEAIKVMVPWFILFILAGVMVLLVYKLFGAPDESISWTVRNFGGLKWGIFIISIIIIGASVSSVYFVGDGSDNSTSLITASEGDVGGVGEGALLATIFHPKMLGLVVVLLIAVFTISLLSQAPTP